jgi:hypothetical protein
MREPRLVVTMVAALVVPAAACGPASFPDGDAVAAAQASYCQALAKVNDAGDSWEHMGACKGATVAGSAGYLRGMAKCLPGRKDAAGDKARDLGIMIAECRDEVLYKLTTDEANAQAAMEARCDRAARCEKASVPECLAQAKKADPAQRATFYGLYNGRAIAKISDCLRSSACGSDEYAAQNACYKPAEDKVLWFP